MKPFRLSALWLIVGAVAVLILLPILNVLFHIEEVMPPLLPPLILLVCLLVMLGGGFLGLGGVRWMGRERERILEAGLPARALIRSTQLGGMKLTYGGRGRTLAGGAGVGGAASRRTIVRSKGGAYRAPAGGSTVSSWRGCPGRIRSPGQDEGGHRVVLGSQMPTWGRKCKQMGTG